MFGWLKRLWTFIRDPPVWKSEVQRVDAEQQNKDLPDLREYSLYEIGEVMCRIHEDGIGKYNNAEQFGQHSMDSVLGRYCGEEILPFHFDELDQLLQDSVSQEQAAYFDPASDMPVRPKVKKFRRAFFDQFTSDQIKQGLLALREREVESFGLQSIVGEQTTDRYTFEWHTTEPMTAQPSMEAAVPDEQTFESETIDMQHVGTQFNLVGSQVTENVTEIVATDAELLWGKLEPYVDEPEHDSVIDDVKYLDVMNDIRQSYFDPDYIIHGRRVYMPDRISSMNIEIESDSTGVIPDDVTSIVADSGSVGYRVTRDEWSVKQPKHIADPYVYRITWTGNYAIVHPDAFDVL
jgi:hypothetical protein